ncbi:MAG: hypothetical protein M1827_005254 [Pycnora praestabilis]|nr:MAG: hypothetical protein M1827_005254 [Pycnora praestabilis]
MQQRIDKLEEIVTTLLSSDQVQQTSENPIAKSHTEDITTIHVDTSLSASGPHTVIEYEQLPKSLGVMNINENYSLYRGSTHWDDVLDEIGALKSTWNQLHADDGEDDSEAPINTDMSGVSLLYGLPNTPEKSDLLISLPARSAADKLVLRFFDQPYSSVSLPSMQSYHEFEDEPLEYQGVSKAFSELYRLRTTQCLALADITRRAPHTLETLIYNALAEQSAERTRQQDSETGGWMTLGMIVRAALQMGYHRDPAQYSSISPFQGEMRRRVWNFVSQVDSLVSFHVGLPSMVRSVESDTTVPRNIFDWELYEEMTELPPSRPSFDATPVAYLIAKNHLLRAVGDIVQYLSSLNPDRYEVVLTLDEKLDGAHTKVPPHLQMRNLEDSVQDPPGLVSQRIQIDHLYHQGMCALHRRFLARARTEKAFALSRRRCIDSSMALLSQQYGLHRSTTLHLPKASRWCSIPLIRNDFILAAMILCLDLQHEKEQQLHKDGLTISHQDGQRPEILRALEVAHGIWNAVQSDVQTTSAEARKVYRVLSIMLEKLDKGDKMAPRMHQGPTTSFPMSETDHSQQEGASMPVGSVFEPAKDTIFSDRQADPLTSKPLADAQDPDLNPKEVPAEINDTPLDFQTDLDWEMWDSFVEGTSFDEAYRSISSIGNRG